MSGKHKPVVGRVVRLNSGGRDMTVVAVSEDGTNVDVRWLNEDGDARRWTFPCAALTLVEFSRLSDLTRSPPASMGGGVCNDRRAPLRILPVPCSAVVPSPSALDDGASWRHRGVPRRPGGYLVRRI